MSPRSDCTGPLAACQPTICESTEPVPAGPRGESACPSPLPSSARDTAVSGATSSATTVEMRAAAVFAFADSKGARKSHAFAAATRQIWCSSDRLVCSVGISSSGARNGSWSRSHSRANESGCCSSA